MKPAQIIERLKAKGVEAYVEYKQHNVGEARNRIRSEFDVDINGNGAIIASGTTWEDVAISLQNKGLI